MLSLGTRRAQDSWDCSAGRLPSTACAKVQSEACSIQSGASLSNSGRVRLELIGPNGVSSDVEQFGSGFGQTEAGSLRGRAKFGLDLNLGSTFLGLGSRRCGSRTMSGCVRPSEGRLRPTWNNSAPAPAKSGLRPVSTRDRRNCGLVWGGLVRPMCGSTDVRGTCLGRIRPNSGLVELGVAWA